jgi:AhpD family alkylhydroperoxidase
MSLMDELTSGEGLAAVMCTSTFSPPIGEKGDAMSHRTDAPRPVSEAHERTAYMTAKLNPYAAAPQLMKNWTATAMHINDSLEASLVELVKIRASQINGCANCINMHTAEAREKGEREQRIYLLSAWREAPCYSERERAALAWTEALTRLSEGHTHEAAYETLAAQFTQEEQVKLTLVINVIGAWNRIAVGFGMWLDTDATRKLEAAV